MCCTQLCHSRQTECARTLQGGKSKQGHIEQKPNVPRGCEVRQSSAQNPRHGAMQCWHPRSSVVGPVCTAPHKRHSILYATWYTCSHLQVAIIQL